MRDDEPQNPLRRDPRVERDLRRYRKEAAAPAEAQSLRRNPRAERDRRRQRPAVQLSGSGLQARSPDFATSSPQKNLRKGRRGEDPGAIASRAPTSRSPETEILRLEAPSCWVLVVPDTPSGTLTTHDRDAIAAARLIADNKDGGVIALAPADATGYGLIGVDRLVPLPGTDADTGVRLALVESILAQCKPAHIVLPDTPLGGGHLGRLIATRQSLNIAPGVVRISGGELVRLSDGGRKEQTLPMAPVVLVAPEVSDPKPGPRREARVLPVPAPPAIEEAVQDHGLLPVDPYSVPLQEADFIISAGNGVSDWDSFSELAKVLNAAIAGTRAVCDANHLPRHRQVGASGTLVSPRCYLSFGISGAPQHLQGIARCERVIAVNTDLHADMIKRADLAIIADAQAVMPSLLALLRETR
ncbi:electron transfer flavoprotein subunit alpha/FixB family protein [Microvirga aerophila]|uniref:electron transfer flavoprotein subunit alpha/FixB family protein n=1 Tax=Microvirga aerophila TaxID=670291 RepID=UPI000DEF3C90